MRRLLRRYGSRRHRGLTLISDRCILAHLKTKIKRNFSKIYNFLRIIGYFCHTAVRYLPISGILQLKYIKKISRNHQSDSCLFGPSYWIRFAFLPKAKIIVETSVCTGFSNMPPAYCIYVGSNPANKKKYARITQVILAYLVRVTGFEPAAS